MTDPYALGLLHGTIAGLIVGLAGGVTLLFAFLWWCVVERDDDEDDTP